MTGQQEYKPGRPLANDAQFRYLKFLFYADNVCSLQPVQRPSLVISGLDARSCARALIYC